MAKSLFKKNKVTKKDKDRAAISRVPLNKVQKQQVKQIVEKEPEVKYHNTYLRTADLRLVTNNTAVIQDDLMLIPIAQEDTGRIGDQIRLKAIEVRLYLEALSTFVSGVFRVIIYQWKDLSVPNITGVLQNIAAGSISGTVDAFSPINHDNKQAGILNVLYDKMFHIVTATENDTRAFYIKVPLKYAKKRIQYSNSSTSAADKVYMTVIADKQGVNTTSVLMAFIARVYYQDP